MSLVQDLLAEVDRFLADVAMAPSTFGRLAVNDGKFITRLRGGAGVTVATIDRARAYMAAERARRVEPERSMDDDAAAGASAAEGAG